MLDEEGAFVLETKAEQLRLQIKFSSAQMRGEREEMVQYIEKMMQKIEGIPDLPGLT